MTDPKPLVNVFHPEQAAKVAHDVAERIIGNVQLMHTVWVKIAEDLYRFNQLEMWRDLGYPSFEQWLAEPAVDIGRRTAYYLLDVWRQLVITNGVKPDELAKVDMSKVQEVLPAVRRGQVSAKDALSDAETLTRNDLRDRYKGVGSASQNGGLAGAPDTSSSYEATAEPEYAICPTCGGRYPVKKS